MDGPNSSQGKKHEIRTGVKKKIYIYIWWTNAV